LEEQSWNESGKDVDSHGLLFCGGEVPQNLLCALCSSKTKPVPCWQQTPELEDSQGALIPEGWFNNSPTFQRWGW